MTATATECVECEEFRRRARKERLWWRCYNEDLGLHLEFLVRMNDRADLVFIIRGAQAGTTLIETYYDDLAVAVKNWVKFWNE